MPSYTSLYTTGVHQEVINFTTMHEKNIWNAEVKAIKAESVAAFNKKEADGLTDEVRQVYNNWMTHVKFFVQFFGEDKTPQDIKWALNTAEEALGATITEWVNHPQASLLE